MRCSQRNASPSHRRPNVRVVSLIRACSQGGEQPAITVLSSGDSGTLESLRERPRGAPSCRRIGTRPTLLPCSQDNIRREIVPLIAPNGTARLWSPFSGHPKHTLPRLHFPVQGARVGCIKFSEFGKQEIISLEEVSFRIYPFPS